jgi:hypothetical protein
MRDSLIDWFRKRHYNSECLYLMNTSQNETNVFWNNDVLDS